MITNCIICRTGRRWWRKRIRRFRLEYVCPTCGSNPENGKGGRKDWRNHFRARMVKRFGPRCPGDTELLEKYSYDHD